MKTNDVHRGTGSPWEWRVEARDTDDKGTRGWECRKEKAIRTEEPLPVAFHVPIRGGPEASSVSGSAGPGRLSHRSARGARIRWYRHASEMLDDDYQSTDPREGSI